MNFQKDLALLTVEELAQRWRKSPETIRSDASRSPSSLPPILRLPGTRRLLWRLEDVERFEAGCVTPVQARTTSAEGPRRGRPTKAEQVRRRLGN